MGLYGIKVNKEKAVLKVIKEVNNRLDGGNGENPALIFLSGKISFISDKTYKNNFILICNIRPMFHIPFFKNIFMIALKKSLKKNNYKGNKPIFLSFSEFSECLEVIL